MRGLENIFGFLAFRRGLMKVFFNKRRSASRTDGSAKPMERHRKLCKSFASRHSRGINSDAVRYLNCDAAPKTVCV